MCQGSNAHVHALLQAGGQTAKGKSKAQDEGDPTDAMMSMISMASSETTLAGLMSLSGPSSSLGDRDGVEMGSAQHWHPDMKPGSEDPSPPNHEVHAPAKVSLSEYRAKNADVLAAQKRKLENMEASVKRDYANAAQALIGQQQHPRKDKQQQQHHHQQPSSHSGSSSSSDVNNPSPIILKIPLEKERPERSSLKMRLPLGGAAGSGHSGSSGRSQDQDIKVRIRMPEKQRGSSGEEGKSRDKHRERSNHHHHHHHHHHHSSSGSAPLSSSHKHSSSAGAAVGSSKKIPSDSSRLSSSSASRKRTHPQDPAAPHAVAKMSKSSRNAYQLAGLSSSSVHALGHAPDSLLPLGLSHPQGSYTHSKGDKADTNGHNAATGGQSNEYQDTFEMLNSLLSAQGVQPAQPPLFDYRPQYGDYRYGANSRGNSARPPPLPSEPPPPLPPLPK